MKADSPVKKLDTLLHATTKKTKTQSKVATTEEVVKNIYNK